MDIVLLIFLRAFSKKGCRISRCHMNCLLLQNRYLEGIYCKMAWTNIRVSNAPKAWFYAMFTRKWLISNIYVA